MAAIGGITILRWWWDGHNLAELVARSNGLVRSKQKFGNVHHLQQTGQVEKDKRSAYILWALFGFVGGSHRLYFARKFFSRHAMHGFLILASFIMFCILTDFNSNAKKTHFSSTTQFACLGFWITSLVLWTWLLLPKMIQCADPDYKPDETRTTPPCSFENYFWRNKVCMTHEVVEKSV
eukprot:TRINITY_DN6334_c0_g1_i1.p1 TRINITY_DN6334_c0_g1~~TRINITY_DN6334_c0_g1_i1.p1  ORF type:complete len:179 (-),score=17.41 TRINITY_DN6334_c0_g1_i1:144-680(-)